MGKGPEYIPLATEPGRSFLQAEREDLEETPLMDFLMGLSGYMELMAAGAALLLTAMLFISM